MSTTATATAIQHLCPKHSDIALRNVMAGGAGFCSRCNLFVQAAGVPEPQLPPEIVAKRAAAKPKRRTKSNAGKARQTR